MRTKLEELALLTTFLNITTFFYFRKTHAYISSKMYFLMIYCKKIEAVGFFLPVESTNFSSAPEVKLNGD